jgi:hypothetical protein
MTQQLIDLDRESVGSNSSLELNGLKLIRIPIGTFGGTLEQVFFVKDDQICAFNTGDQGGGQN